jgi:peroxiredoxin
MKKYIALFIALLPLSVLAQSPFIITANVPNFTDGDKIYLFYRVNGAKFSDSTVVKNKAFVFKGTIEGLGTGYICRNDNPSTADILHDSQYIYIEPGNIIITTADSLRNAAITGTSINRDYTDLNIALQRLTPKSRAIGDYFDALTPAQQEDPNIIADVRAKTKVVDDQMAPIKFAFIKTHPNSYISLVTLQRMVNNAEILQVEQAYNGLTSTAKSGKLGMDIGKLIASAKQSRLGVMATDFTLPTPSGKPVKLSDFKGKYVLVDFWASWCWPCRQENPNVKAAFEKYKSKGFTVLSISIDDRDGRAAWLAAIKKDGLPWTQVQDRFASGKKVKELYGVTTIPANVLVDPSGKIIGRNIKDKVLQNTLAGLFEGK